MFSEARHHDEVARGSEGSVDVGARRWPCDLSLLGRKNHRHL